VSGIIGGLYCLYGSEQLCFYSYELLRFLSCLYGSELWVWA